MTLLTVGLNHNTAPLAIRERLAVPYDHSNTALAALTALPRVSEGAIVSTCNRTEVYAVAHYDDDAELRHWLCDSHGLDSQALAPHFYAYRDRETIRHTLRVASGLDSLIVGEPQILGQMKQALQAARAAQAAGPLLTRLFQHSFAVAKRVRSETGIGANPVSVAYAGVSLARQIFADFATTTAMFIGAGDTVALTARHLFDAGMRRMVFANRSLERAQDLASRFTGYAICLDDVGAHLQEADMVVASTNAGDYLLTLGQIRAAVKQRRRRPMFMLDLAVPRNIEPAAGALEDVYLYSVDDLQGVIRDNLHARQQAAILADSMIDLRIDEFVAWLDSRRASHVISGLRRNAEDERDEVIARAQRMLARGADPAQVLEFVGHRLTNKLLHPPTSVLRRARGETQRQLLASARSLFRLSDGDER